MDGMNLVFQSLQVVLIEEMSDRTVPASLLSLSLPSISVPLASHSARRPPRPHHGSHQNKVPEGLRGPAQAPQR